MPWSLWLPRAALIAGVVCVVFFGALWLLTDDPEWLGIIGGLWAIARVAQFLIQRIIGAGTSA